MLSDNGDGSLLILGVNSYVTKTSGGDPVASYVSYVGNESAAIDALVSQWAAIPEPSTWLLLVAAIPAFVVTGRRRPNTCK